ncbi:hypothetical protein VP01_27g7 [Puccinia sorghi]|uniref:Uncharacterized protein n=1 Tax=Puccinia sorghi TaxID=27349 RepID=A0A0L6V397_9BASI|nr:hypothetical protein VP01_27g7 [Puccinia sorghi]
MCWTTYGSNPSAQLICPSAMICISKMWRDREDPPSCTSHPPSLGFLLVICSPFPGLLGNLPPQCVAYSCDFPVICCTDVPVLFLFLFLSFYFPLSSPQLLATVDGLLVLLGDSLGGGAIQPTSFFLWTFILLEDQQSPPPSMDLSYLGICPKFACFSNYTLNKKNGMIQLIGVVVQLGFQVSNTRGPFLALPINHVFSVPITFLQEVLLCFGRLAFEFTFLNSSIPLPMFPVLLNFQFMQDVICLLRSLWLIGNWSEVFLNKLGSRRFQQKLETTKNASYKFLFEEMLPNTTHKEVRLVITRGEEVKFGTEFYLSSFWRHLKLLIIIFELLLEVPQKFRKNSWIICF